VEQDYALMIIHGVEYTREKLAGIIDYAILDPDTTAGQIAAACRVAREYGFKGVHPNPIWVEAVADALEGTGIETGLVVSFPFGAVPTSFKVHEAAALVRAVRGRPACIDVVTNIGSLKDGNYSLYTSDIAEVVKVGHAAGIEVKAILEVAMLTDDEVKAACGRAVEAGADFVKCSTGRGGPPAIRHVKIMRQAVPAQVGVKFSGYGSYNPAQMTVMALAAGATRLGTRRGPEIIREIDSSYAGAVML
jgi:deoxyribose-phosphate aldolase